MELTLAEQTLLIALGDEKGWVGRLPRELEPLRTRVAQSLVRRGVLSEERSKLIGLLEPLDLIDAAVPKPDRRAARKRAKEVAEHGLAGTAVRDAVQEVQMAVMVAVMVPTVITTASN